LRRDELCRWDIVEAGLSKILGNAELPAPRSPSDKKALASSSPRFCSKTWSRFAIEAVVEKHVSNVFVNSNRVLQQCLPGRRSKLCEAGGDDDAMFSTSVWCRFKIQSSADGFLSASSLTPSSFLTFNHPDITALKYGYFADA
jgi:hypothetical protein